MVGINMEQQIECHPLKPFLPKSARVLILGSFPPPKRRWKMEFYYPNFNNDMWRIIGLVFYKDKDYFIDPQLKTFKQDLIQQCLSQYGIAISDVAQKIIRLQENAADKFLQLVEKTDFNLLLQAIPECHTIITTGEKATEVLFADHVPYKLKLGETASMIIDQRMIEVYRVPSSSRAYPLALQEKAKYYQEVFRHIGLIKNQT